MKWEFEGVVGDVGLHRPMPAGRFGRWFGFVNVKLTSKFLRGRSEHAAFRALEHQRVKVTIEVIDSLPGGS